MKLCRMRRRERRRNEGGPRKSRARGRQKMICEKVESPASCVADWASILVSMMA